MLHAAGPPKRQMQGLAKGISRQPRRSRPARPRQRALRPRSYDPVQCWARCRHGSSGRWCDPSLIGVDDRHPIDMPPKKDSKVNHLVARLRVRALGMVTRLVPAPTPFMFTGPGSSTQLVQMIADRGARSALVVTDAVLLKLKVVDPVLVALEEAGIKARVFSDVEPDPTIDVVMDGVARLRESRADAVLAVGGGSPIDAAKAMIACSAKGCSPDALNGYFRVRRAVAPFFAIPTPRARDPRSRSSRSFPIRRRSVNSRSWTTSSFR